MPGSQLDRPARSVSTYRHPVQEGLIGCILESEVEIFWPSLLQPMLMLLLDLGRLTASIPRTWSRSRLFQWLGIPNRPGLGHFLGLIRLNLGWVGHQPFSNWRLWCCSLVVIGHSKNASFPVANEHPGQLLSMGRFASRPSCVCILISESTS